MSANKNKDLYDKNLSPENLSVNTKDSGILYVNLNQTQTGPRFHSNNDNNVSNKNQPIKPLTVNNVNKLPSSKDNYNNVSKNSNPKNWYSPPSSVKSDSRPPSTAAPKQPTKKNLPKLQTIDENSIILSTDKVLSLCTNNNVEIQLNALAYLQHLTFKNTDKKMEIRNSNGLRTIIELTRSPKSSVANGALRVLKNISFSDVEIICTDIERLAGIQRMTSIIKSNSDIFLKELAVDVLWNLSINYTLKNIILTETVKILMQHIILPECKLEKKPNGDFAPSEESINWSIILRNSLGIIRNISYESPEARIKLREEDLLIDIIFYLIQSAKDVEETEDNIENVSLIDSKIIENCACILRNLTYAIQEILDVNYLENRKNLSPKSKSSTKNKDVKQNVLSLPINDNPKGVDLLMNSKYVVERLIPILKYGVNAVTLEAVAGIVQNLTAGDWEPSKELQTEFRIQQALPLLVEIIDIAPDDVIRSAATALRNLVQEENTCMLIGSNGLHILTGKIPMHSKSKIISNPALAAILSTIYAVIKNQDEFMKKFIIEKGAQGCIYVRDSDEFINPDDEFPDKIPQFCKHILELLWKTSAARELLKNKKYKQSDIVKTRNIDPCNLCAPSISTKPKYPYDNNDNRNSVGMDSNDRSLHGNQRDSCSTMVSNYALQQRNSMALTTKVIPGYGQVKSNQISKHNYPNNYSQNVMNSINEKNDNHFRNQSNNYNNSNSNQRNDIDVQNKYSPPRKSEMYNSYTNNSYTGSQDDISSNISSRSPKKIGNRPPPALPNKRDSRSSINTNSYQHEYSIPNKSYKSPITKNNQEKVDSWV